MLDKIIERCHKIVVNKGIIDEYTKMAYKAGVTARIILADIDQSLRPMNKIQQVKKYSEKIRKMKVP